MSTSSRRDSADSLAAPVSVGMYDNPMFDASSYINPVLTLANPVDTYPEPAHTSGNRVYATADMTGHLSAVMYETVNTVVDPSDTPGNPASTSANPSEDDSPTYETINAVSAAVYAPASQEATSASDIVGPVHAHAMDGTTASNLPYMEADTLDTKRLVPPAHLALANPVYDVEDIPVPDSYMEVDNLTMDVSHDPHTQV